MPSGIMSSWHPIPPPVSSTRLHSNNHVPTRGQQSLYPRLLLFPTHWLCKASVLRSPSFSNHQEEQTFLTDLLPGNYPWVKVEPLVFMISSFSSQYGWRVEQGEVLKWGGGCGARRTDGCQGLSSGPLVPCDWGVYVVCSGTRPGFLFLLEGPHHFHSRTGEWRNIITHQLKIHWLLEQI